MKPTVASSSSQAGSRMTAATVAPGTASDGEGRMHASKTLTWGRVSCGGSATSSGSTKNVASKLQEAAGARTVPTWQSASPSSVPKTSSSSELMAAVMFDVFVTVYVKTTSSPSMSTM